MLGKDNVGFCRSGTELLDSEQHSASDEAEKCGASKNIEKTIPHIGIDCNVRCDQGENSRESNSIRQLASMSRDGMANSREEVKDLVRNKYLYESQAPNSHGRS